MFRPIKNKRQLARAMGWLVAWSLLLGGVIGLPATPVLAAGTISCRVTLNSVGEPGVIVGLSSLFTGAPITSTVTDASGNYQFNNRIGDFRVSVRKGVFDFTPSSRSVNTTFFNATADFVMKRPPIIIQGGYSPQGIPWHSILNPDPKRFCPQTRLDGTTYNPGACPNDFIELITALRNAGYDVSSVMMESPTV